MSRTLRRNSNGTTGNDYRTTVKKFNNTSYYLNSLEFETSIYKDALDPNSPDANLYSRIRNEYKVYELDRSNGNNRILSSSGNLVALPLPFDIGESKSRKQAIVLLKKTNTIVKELSTDFIENEIQFSYDIWAGN
uniref:hypothetical protein n=1 Tax=Flavobacterium sp. TaxID=239 RepID=UPI00404724AE